MCKTLCSILVSDAVTSVALAEPVPLTDVKMDQVAGGNIPAAPFDPSKPLPIPYRGSDAPVTIDLGPFVVELPAPSKDP
jgi:hypothetical protein